MKILKNIATGLVLLFIASCKPEEFGPIGEPRAAITSQLTGTWQIDKVIQFDENAVKYDFPNKQMDITSIYPYKEFTITFNLNEAGIPTTFTSVQGNAPKIIGLSDGAWSVDNADAPKVITLTKGTIVSKIEISNYSSLKQGRLNLKLVKYFNNKPVLSYQFELIKK
ncbi:MAG: DUF5004 domain-containing protein [Pyrinomonadaceae bacterium]|nr:DUF5004 domain-containing protein [Sphingobacteriaceae bacterium]